MKSTIELNNLELKLSLGTYSPDDLVPEVHLLQLISCFYFIKSGNMTDRQGSERWVGLHP